MGDASALANADNLAAITGLDKDVLNALIGKVTLEAQMNGDTLQVARDRLNQELASFGLGTQTQGQGTSNTTGFGISGGYASMDQQPIAPYHV